MIETIKKHADVLEDVPLNKYNTYHIGGITKYLVSPLSINDLVEVIKILDENKVPYFILGNGSNVVLSSKKFEGAIIRLNNIAGIAIHPELSRAYAEAGAMFPKLVMESIEKGLTGLEFAGGIPGTIGGSIYSNAGAYNACIMDYIESVTVLNKETYEIEELEHEDITYSYRNTMFKEEKKYIVLSAKFYLKPGEKANSLAILEDRKRRRLESQPLEYPSAGSVFRNPDGDFAGRIIEECNLKGTSIGGAEVSEKHANFIINKDNATSDDVYELINLVHDTVLEKTTVDLKIEQEFIGWD